ncbi:arginase [Chytridium lagenaria]|nr:arginase [Chytridium lagenaria]
MSIVNTRTKQRYPRGGVEQGPAMLLEHGLVDQIKELDWKVAEGEAPKSYEDMKPKEEVKGKLKNVSYVSKVTESVYHSVKSICSQRQLALTLGGDHSIAIGHQHSETSSSGNLHGCPVAFLTGLAGKVETFEWLKPCLPKNRIVYIGLRDLDAPEKKILRDNNIKAFSMHEVDRWGIAQVMEMAMDYLGRDCPIHLSFDVDALDPTVAPATGTPVRGGLTFREGHYIMEIMHQTGFCESFLGDSVARAQTIQIGCSLIRSALGEGLLY